MKLVGTILTLGLITTPAAYGQDAEAPAEHKAETILFKGKLVSVFFSVPDAGSPREGYVANLEYLVVEEYTNSWLEPGLVVRLQSKHIVDLETMTHKTYNETVRSVVPQSTDFGTSALVDSHMNEDYVMQIESVHAFDEDQERQFKVRAETANMHRVETETLVRLKSLRSEVRSIRKSIDAVEGVQRLNDDDSAFAKVIADLSPFLVARIDNVFKEITAYEGTDQDAIQLIMLKDKVETQISRAKTLMALTAQLEQDWFVSPKQLAKEWQVTPGYAVDQCERAGIPGYFLGDKNGNVRYRRKHVDAYLESRKVIKGN
jgi:hypothetical protein